MEFNMFYSTLQRYCTILTTSVTQLSSSWIFTRFFATKFECSHILYIKNVGIEN